MSCYYQFYDVKFCYILFFIFCFISLNFFNFKKLFIYANM